MKGPIVILLPNAVEAALLRRELLDMLKLTETHSALAIQSNDYFTDRQCEHPTCAAPANASVEFTEPLTGLEAFVCSAHLTDERVAAAESEVVDPSKNRINVCPWWLRYTRNIPAPA